MRAIWIGCCVTWIGCAAHLESPERFDEVCAGDVQETILVPRCARAGCHVPYEPTGGVEYLTAGLPSRLIGIEATTCAGRLLIDPADPDASFLLERLSDSPHCGELAIDRMPMLSTPLDEHELGCVRQWVHALAENAP